LANSEWRMANKAEYPQITQMAQIIFSAKSA
jgi:hypothetical protein